MDFKIENKSGIKFEKQYGTDGNNVQIDIKQ